jgi:hypothetical protein
MQPMSQRVNSERCSICRPANSLLAHKAMWSSVQRVCFRCSVARIGCRMMCVGTGVLCASLKATKLYDRTVQKNN